MNPPVCSSLLRSMLILGALLLVAPAEAGTDFRPDLILHSGRVVTVNSQFDIAEAVAIRGNRIVAVGADDDVLARAGDGTRLVDLDGLMVIPGLIDNHHHFLSKAIDVYLGADVTLSESIAEMVEIIGRKVEQTPPGELVYTTSGWMQTQFAEQRTPTRHDLDPVSPDNPVVVQGGHSLYLNTLALQMAGITAQTSSPEGGSIERDPDTGEPTGRLIENAMYLANRWALGEATHEQKLNALRHGQRLKHSVGVTGLREPGIPAEDMRVYHELWRSGELKLRVSMNLHLDPSRPADALLEQLATWGVATGFGDAMLRLDGIGEFGLDGGFEAGLMSEPYANTPDDSDPDTYFGLQRIPTDKFTTVMIGMNRLGWRGNVHAVGDKAIDVLLDAYGAADEDRPLRERRWVLDHAHVTRPDQFERIKDLGVVISTQFHPYMAAENMAYYWGEARANEAMRVRDWLDADLIVGGGSDWSLLPANPFWMLHFWVTRETRLGGVSGAEQAVSREEALRLMTINNAYITFEEDIKGSIEVGKLADLVVLGDDYLEVPAQSIRDIRVLATIIDGEVVYESEQSPIGLGRPSR